MGYLALIMWLVGCIVLLRIERRENPSSSWLVWVPTLWCLICGSRPVATWFTLNSGGSVDYEAGSFWDRWIFSSLIALALFVVITQRQINWSRMWKDNWGVLLLFAYLGISVIWSD